MNIDIDKLKEVCEPLDLRFLSVHNLLKKCEIKVNCDDCERQNGISTECYACFHNKVDHFKPKQNELDNLFIGAPVVQVGTENGAFVRAMVFDGNKEYKRLPTASEAPRNVWLAPWLKMPENLAQFNILYRYKKEDVEHCCTGENLQFNWDEVEAIMILEDLKK